MGDVNDPSRGSMPYARAELPSTPRPVGDRSDGGTDTNPTVGTGANADTDAKYITHRCTRNPRRRLNANAQRNAET